ncbi:hypothetical protein LXA43DRAFT_882047 [Ganoderma leucocontextum]|nr:hypothetical protein LXA43DRAFT_882047 [Ganoderma leucocontextum]
MRHWNTSGIFAVLNQLSIKTIQSFFGAGANPNLNPMCGRQIKVSMADGKSVTMTVADMCPTCAVDLTPVAFQQVALLAVGRLHDVSSALV